MTSLAENSVQRSLTAAFIAADPLTVTLTRRLRVRNDAGGYDEATTNLPPQTVRLIPSSDRTPQIETADGRNSLPVFTLLAMPDADLKIGDTFRLSDGCEYQLEGAIFPMHTESAYEKKAGVIRRGA